MTILLGILLTLLVFFVVIMIHEWGHFITARMTGMRVLEFGFGIPPKIKKIFTDKKGTEFTVNALPLGGFVRIDGEDASASPEVREGTFLSKSLWKRLLVLVAGVVMNVVLAWAIFSALFLIGTRPLAPLPFDIEATNSYFLPSLKESIVSGFVQNSGVAIRPLDDSVVKRAGLRDNDVIVAVNGEKVTSADFLVKQISQNIPLELEILRQENSQKISQKITISPENGKIGAQIFENFAINQDFLKKESLGNALVLGVKEVYFTAKLTFSLVGKTLKNLFFSENSEDFQAAKNNLSGPIGAGSAVISMVEHAVPVTTILIFVALLSINLAVMNILPFPALDGGRMLFTTLYSLFLMLGFSHQKISKYEGRIHATGFLLLLAFMVYVASLDIFRIFQ